MAQHHLLRYLVVLLGVALSAVSCLQAQPTHLQFVDLAVAHETGTWFAQDSARFALYRSTDLGETWHDVEFLWNPFLRTIVPTNGAIIAVPNSPWADDVGNPYPVYRSTDDGQTWEVVESLVGTYVQRIVTTGTAAFVMTTTGELYRTTDAGISLQEVTLPSDTWGQLASVDAAPGVVLLASSLSSVLISHDDGATWEPFTPPATDCGEPLLSGGLLAVTCGDSLFTSTTAGRSWQSRASVTDQFQLLSIDTHIYLASGHDVEGLGHAYYVAPASQPSDWVVVDSVLPRNIGNWFWDRDVMIVRTVDSIATSSDGGATWRRAACQVAPQESFSLFDDARDSALFGCIGMGMVAPSGTLFGSSSAFILFNSLDSGRSWDLTNFPIESFPGRWWFSGTQMIVQTVGNDYQNILLASHSEGTGWRDLELPSGEMMLSVANNLGVVVKMSDGTIHRKQIEESTWKKVKLDSNVTEFAATPTMMYALMGSMPDKRSGKMSKEYWKESSNGGATWRTLPIPNNAQIQQVAPVMVWSIEGKEVVITLQEEKKVIHKPWMAGQYGIMEGRDSLYLMGGNDPSGNQFFVSSINGSDGWRPIDGRFPQGYVSFFAVHKDLLYLTVEDIAYRSEDHGATWQRLGCR